MKLTKVAALGAALGVVVAGAAIAAPAHADPVTDGYSIVGSDTLQDAVTALSNGTNISGSPVRVSGLGKNLGSWDAFTPGIAGGVGFIQTKPYGVQYPRPTGSGAGKTALLRSIDGTPLVISGNTGANTVLNGSYTVTNQIDLARSSSGATTNANGVLLYVPFGQDALAYGYVAGSGVSSASLAYVASLTGTQLNQIYAANTNTAIAGEDDVIQPLIPQAGSGTRSFFLGAIGNPTLGTAVAAGGTTLPENNGSVFAPAADTIQIIPFSAASYIAQANGAAPLNTTTGVALGSPNGLTPFTGTAPNLVPSTALYNDATFGRTVYIIAPYAKVTVGQPGYDAGLAALVDPTSTSSLTYFGASGSPTTTKAVKLKFGFLAPTGTAFRAN